MEKRIMITVKEAAELLGVTTKTVYHWIDQGRLPSHRLGNQYYLERSEVDSILSESGQVIPELKSVEISSDPLLSEMLQSGGIHYNVPGKTRNEALRNALSLIQGMDARVMEPIFQMFISREELASTGLGDGIAIPHARGTLVGYVNRPLLSLSFLLEPVEYDAIDGKPVDILFLLVSPNVQTHLRILARLAFLLQEPSCREAILSRAPREQILQVISSVEQQLAVKGT